MFKKLKRRFILTNLLTSTAVLVVAFSSIYIVAASTTHQRENPKFERPEQSTQTEFFTIEFNQEMAERIEAEREASLQTLLVSLIITGVFMECFIALISIYLAEQSIKPVRDAYLAQKDFVANASHEIKTPLAVIQANLEAADIRGNQWIDNAVKKTEDLTKLNNQLLALARTDTIVDDTQLEETDVDKLLGGIINSFSPNASAKNIKLSKKITASKKTLTVNRQALEQIVNIYVDNGIKYGKKEVTVKFDKNKIDVISDGEPMDAEKIPHLFERFYQSDKTADGVGLGLAIAKSIADKNGWKVYANVSKNPRRNVFTLEFK